MPSKATKTRKRNSKKIKANLDTSFKRNDEEAKKQVVDLIGRHAKSSKDFKFKLATFKREIVGNKYSEMDDKDIIDYEQKVDNVLKLMFPGNFQRVELSTQKKCALCFQEPFSWDDSGPLIGPVQVNLAPIVIPLELKLERKEEAVDSEEDSDEEIFDFEPQKHFIAFHKQCLLEADGINIIVPEKLEKLGHQLQRFWKLPCKKCKKFGASIKVKGKITSYTHYHCIIKKNKK
uniref:TFIIS central domain-containing protein n=1 Tax=Strongyloides papillosus TaxID=174720 RepID=A0A0N5CFV8_STREA